MQVTPGELGPGFCPTSEQVRLNAYAAALAVTFPLGLFNGSYGNATPPPDMQSFPWYRLNSDGSPDRWYVYFNGAWVSPNPIAANDTAAIRFFQGPYASISTYDGGDTNTPGSASGPMWVVIGQTTGGATDYGSMGGLMPIGVSATYAQGMTGGAASATLTLPNMPPHSHTPQGGLNFSTDNNTGAPITIGGTPFGSAVPATSVVGGNPDGSTLPVSTISPYIAGYWICRSGRIFYLASEGS